MSEVSDSEKGATIAHGLRDPDVEVLVQLLEVHAGTKWTAIKNFT
jgi:hypothetical protein